MGGILKFFLNALKAIFLGPFYVAYFILFFVYGIINHFIGEIKVIFTGFRYGTKSENKYTRRLIFKVNEMKKGGGQ